MSLVATLIMMILHFNLLSPDLMSPETSLPSKHGTN